MGVDLGEGRRFAVQDRERVELLKFSVKLGKVKVLIVREVVLALNVEVSLGKLVDLLVDRLCVSLGVDVEVLIVDGLGRYLSVEGSDGQRREEGEAHLLYF